jgi:excisionase family DNA binding protein
MNNVICTSKIKVKTIRSSFSMSNPSIHYGLTYVGICLPLEVIFYLWYSGGVMNFMTTLQAAEILGVNDSRVRQLIRSGTLKAVQVGRAYLLEESTVKAFVRPPMGRPPSVEKKVARKPAKKARARK